MQTLGLTMAWLIALLSVGTLIDVVIGSRRLRDLGRVTPMDAGPTVSLIVAARNEERGIEPAVRSLLRLAYSPLEVIVVNDRSTDATGSILSRVRESNPRLTVLTVDTLPAGWLGKNHALAFGASRARGDLLLFTDADVVFEPTTVGRAVRFLEDERLDHLTALPHVELRDRLLTVLVVSFGILFALYTRPWKARDPKSWQHIGVGAFNLIRASAYRTLGTHAAIALRPDDDIRLGKAVKQAGLLQDVVIARDFIAVEWYTTAREMVDGLMKNAFAGVNYSLPLLFASTVALLALHVWPWLAVAVTSGTVRWLAMVAVACVGVIALSHTRMIRVSPAYALLHPVGVLAFIYIMWRSATLALTRGAISWRNTSYALADMRRATPASPLPSLDASTTGAPGSGTERP